MINTLHQGERATGSESCNPILQHNNPYVREQEVWTTSTERHVLTYARLRDVREARGQYAQARHVQVANTEARHVRKMARTDRTRTYITPTDTAGTNTARTDTAHTETAHTDGQSR